MPSCALSIVGHIRSSHSWSFFVIIFVVVLIIVVVIVAVAVAVTVVLLASPWLQEALAQKEMELASSRQLAAEKQRLREEAEAALRDSR